MLLKIKFFLIISLAVFFCGLTAAQEADELITDIKWQEDQNLLFYNLAKEALVKIRVGSYAGPVYRTIVNLEKRQIGQNKELWDGKDEGGKINFLKYAKPHFCVDIPVKQNADSPLIVKFAGGLDATDKIRVDIQDKLRPLFLKDGAELRVYLDNKLIKIEKVTVLPFMLNLKKDEILEGNHLLTINLWQALDFSAVAYNSLEVSITKKETNKPGKQTRHLPKARLAFSRQDKKGFWQIFTSALDGRKIKQLTSSYVDNRYPAWSADGNKIAYVNNLGKLWIMDSFGRDSHKINLSLNCSEPKFSPDGTKVIFTSQDDVYNGSSKLWQVNLKDLELKKIVNRPWLQYNPNYSPDGKFIIFTDGPELFGQNILKLSLENNDITQVTDNGPYDYDMQGAFLNSGQEIVYSTNEGASDYDIYKMDKFGRDKINLSHSPQNSDIMPQVSADDQKIFFLSDRSGTFQIWQMNIDGSEPKKITEGSGINSFSLYTE